MCVGGGGGGCKKTELEIACCGVVCIDEFLTPFSRHGRTEYDGRHNGAPAWVPEAGIICHSAV